MFKTKNIWIGIVILIVLISLIVVYIQSNSELDANTGKVIDNTIETTVPDYGFVTRTNGTYNYSAQVPNDWVEVTKDGFDTYVHSPSATSLQIEVGKYAPTLLQVNAESVQAQLAASELVLTDFAWYSPTQYSTIYQKVTDSDTIIYIEITSFDRDLYIRQIYTINSKHYEKMQNLISAMIDGFIWTPANPFPTGYTPYYSEFGNFEFVYPENWNAGQTDNAFVFQCPDTNATISIVITESSNNFAELDKLDYVEYASTSRPSFMLLSYNADDKLIFAESSYVANSTEMRLVQYIIATGSYEFTISYEASAEAYSVQSEIFSQVVNCFRYFS